MNTYCSDRDILALEPVLFLGSGRTGHKLASGSDASISQTTLSSPSSDFQAAGIQPGMVLTTYDASASEGRSCEIVSVDSASQLTVSVLRASLDDQPVAPAPGGTSFFIRTFGPQITAVEASLVERLRTQSESRSPDPASFVDSAQLRMIVAFGTVATVFLSMAVAATPADANWTKAQHYRGEFRRLQIGLRLSCDLDGDGIAESTRALGDVNLRRV